MSTVSFHGPSTASHVRPSRRLTFVEAVPRPTAGRMAMAFALRSNAVLICSIRSMARCYSTRVDQKTDADWRQALTPQQYKVLREHGTEPPGSSPLNHEKRDGTFACAGCGQPLFSADTKYESGSGWPSFFKPLDDTVETTTDRSHGMTRVEVHCKSCGGHLGHVFPDGPQPTGMRYCMNGAALAFDPERKTP